MASFDLSFKVDAVTSCPRTLVHYHASASWCLLCTIMAACEVDLCGAWLGCSYSCQWCMSKDITPPRGRAASVHSQSPTLPLLLSIIIIEDTQLLKLHYYCSQSFLWSVVSHTSFMDTILHYYGSVPPSFKYYNCYIIANSTNPIN